VAAIASVGVARSAYEYALAWAKKYTGGGDKSMTPWEYASRYLPIQVPGSTQTYPIDISRYHLGTPTAAKDQILGAIADHFATNQRKNAGYRLKLRVNSVPVEFGRRDELIPSLNAFWGKGSPEDCQIVLQLALILACHSRHRSSA
jgi:hypothetical protein